MTNEKDREEAIKLVDRIYSTHGFISQKDSRSLQLGKQQLNARAKERENALVDLVLSYRAEAVQAERARIAEMFESWCTDLSDDQEAAEPHNLYERHSGVTTDVNGKEEGRG